MANIKAVIFDVDGVLVDSLKANHKFFTDLLGKFGYGFMTEEEYLPLFHSPMKDMIRLCTKSTDEKKIEEIWEAGKQVQVKGGYPFDLLRKPENLDETIKFLSENYILGVTSGRTKKSIYLLPPLISLEKYFKVTIGYQDTKNHKPHPEPLLLAAEKLGILPEECVYVGDTSVDSIAAKAAGMVSIAYAKEHIEGADYTVFSFQELLKVIKSL